MAFYSGDILPHGNISGSSDWKTGSGLFLHHSGDTKNLKPWYLDKERDWKTGWSVRGPTPSNENLQNANFWGMTGGYAGWSEDRDRWHKKDPTGRAAYTTGNWQKAQFGEKRMALEVLDWGAYDKDNLYKGWLKDQGKDQFESLEDIIAAEDWMQAGGSGGGKFDASGLEAGIAANVGKLGELTSDIGTKVSQKDYDKLTGQLSTRLGDLESKGVHTGDVKGLQEQLDSILGGQQTGDEQLQGLIDQYGQASTQSIGDLRSDLEGNYLSTSDFETSMASNLQGLQDTMQGQWGQDIAQLDIGSIRDAISAQGGDLSSLGANFAGLESDLAGFQAQTEMGLQGAADLNESERAALKQKIEAGEQLSATERQQMKVNFSQQMNDQYNDLHGDISSGLEYAGTARADIRSELSEKYADLGEQLRSGLSGLDKTFTEDLTQTRDALTGELEGLTGKQVDLSKGLEGVKESLGDYKTDVATQFGGIQKEYTDKFGQEAAARTSGLSQEAAARTEGLSQEAAARTSGLNALAQSGQQAISDVYKTRGEAIGELESTWGKNLQAQEDSISDKLAEGKAEMNKRLSDLASTMNYRMLGNSALGIRSRRSEAFKSGAVSTGTGQLSRGSSRINTLNIA